MINVVEMSADSVHFVGPAYTFALCRDNTRMQRDCAMTWPQPGSSLETEMHELAIATCMLLGFTFHCGTDETPGWTVAPWYARHNDILHNQKFEYANSAGECACRCLARFGRWVAYNKADNKWEIVRV